MDNIHHISLKNGFKIIYIERSNSEVLGMSLLGKAGSSFEDIPGTAHYLEHIALNGTEKYKSTKDLALTVQKAGGITNARTGKEFVEYYVKTINSEIENGFDFLSQVVFHPLIQEKDVEKQRKIITQEINRALSDNQRQLFETMVGQNYKSEIMKRMVLGTAESINNITSESMKKFWSKHYTSKNFVLSIAGNADIKTITNLGEKYFGNINTNGETEFSDYQLEEDRYIEICERNDVAQAKISISFPAPLRDSDGYYPFLLIWQILGRGTLSRLFESIREERHIAYDISTWRWEGKNYNLFYVQAGNEEKDVNQLIDLTAKELEKICKESISEDELNFAKKKFKANMLFAFENTFELASYHASLHFRTSENLNYKDELNNIDSVSREQIKKTAKEIFSKRPKVTILGKNIKGKDIDLEPLLKLNKILLV